MSTTTPNLTLTLYDSTTDQVVTFATFRAVWGGTATTSNFYRIDTWAGTVNSSITTLQNQRGAIPVPASYISANYYEATVVSITSYITGMTILLKLDTDSAGTVTLNINALGTKSVTKVNSSGSIVNITGAELQSNRYYMFTYDGTQWVWVNADSADQVYHGGTSGSVVLVASDGSISDSVTQSSLIKNTVNSSTAKTTISNADKIPLLDSDSSNDLKHITGENLRSQMPLDFRNKIINGDMMVAQRGTSFTSGSNNDDTYNLDRYIILSDGNDIVDITQSTTVPSGFMNSIALDVETIDKKFGILQIIENKNCEGIIGNTVTLSFYAKITGSSLSNVKAGILSWDGTADSVTSDVVSSWNSSGTTPTLVSNWTFENTPSNLNVTSSWARYSVTATIDTAGTNNVAVFIWSDDSTTTLSDFLYITGVQLELGSYATPYNIIPYDIEYNVRCVRYYERWNTPTANVSYPPIGIAYSTTGAVLQLPMKPKRNFSSVTIGYSSVSHYRYQTQTLNAITIANRLDNFAVATITTASTWTSGVAGFLTTDSSAPSTAYIDFTNEL